MRFSPEGRSVRVWVKGMPGADETEVVAGRITELGEEGAVLQLHRDSDLGSDTRRPRRLRVVPHEPGWGFEAMWFSFIAVDVFTLDDGDPVGRWFIRLGSGTTVPSQNA